MKGYIYKYTYPNGKVYIGQTRTTIEKRLYEHINASKHPERMTLCEMAIAKYGKPEVEVLEEFEVEDSKKTVLIDLLNTAEKKWIAEYDSTNREKGYNIQNGGEVITPEQYILEEKWYDVYEKEEWGWFIGGVREILDSIIEKNGNVGDNNEIIDFHLKSSDMTKEEQKVWYGIKFMSHLNEKEVTFSSFVKTCPVSDYLSDIIEHAFDEFVEDISNQIWDRIMKKKNKIVKEWYKKKV